MHKQKGTKIDLFKCFSQVTSLDEFTSIEVCGDHGEDERLAVDNHHFGTNHLVKEELPKKQEIIIPKNEIFDQKYERPPEAKVSKSLEYSRVFKKDIVPRNDLYHMTEDDVAYVKELNSKMSSRGMKITYDTFENFIRDLELATEKFEAVPLESAQAIVKEKKYDSAFSENLEDIYNYWRKTRKELKRPLLRKFWKCILADDNNPRFAFRPREKEKRKLRRANKMDDGNTLKKLKTLYSEMEMLKKEVKAINIREKLKANVLEIKYFKFMTIKNEKDDMILYKEITDRCALTSSEHRKISSKIKNFLTALKDRDNEVPEPVENVWKPAPARIPTPSAFPSSAEDLTFNSTAFIASCIIDAISHGITPKYFEEIIAATNVVKPKPKAIQPTPGPSEEMEVEKQPRTIQLQNGMNSVNTSSTAIATVNVGTSSRMKSERDHSTKQTTAQRNIAKFLLRKRRGRLGRYFLDRIPILDGEGVSANTPSSTGLNQYNINGGIHSNDLLHQFYPKRRFITMDANDDKDFIIEARNSKFEGIYDFDDSEDDIKEVSKNIRRLTSSNQKNVMKQQQRKNSQGTTVAPSSHQSLAVMRSPTN